MALKAHRIYDEFGSLLKETLPNGLITEYTYDENKNLIKKQTIMERDYLRLW